MTNKKKSDLGHVKQCPIKKLDRILKKGQNIHEIMAVARGQSQGSSLMGGRVTSAGSHKIYI